MRRIGSIFAVLSLVACGSSVSPADPGPVDGSGTDGAGTDGGKDGGGAVTADQACTELGGGYCDKIYACAPLFGDITYGDIATCKTRLKASCLTSLSATGVAETPAMTSDCAKDLATATCEDLFAKKTPPRCIPAPGAVADGAVCGDPEQCASGFCAYKADSICGTCAPIQKPGEACINAQCGRGLNCVLGKCQPPGMLGESCSTRDTPCATGLSCFGGKCVKAGGPGAKCDKAEIDDPDCDGTQGVFCNNSTKVCQKALSAKAGETCGLSGTDYKLCVGGSICKVATGTFSGTCVAPAADGASCSAGSEGPGCLQPAYCIGGVCKLSDPNSCK